MSPAIDHKALTPAEVLDRAAAFDAPSDIERQRDRFKAACIQMQHEVCQTLGKALGFPMYKDDQVVFPGADDSIGYFTEPHTAESMADLALDRIVAHERREKVLRLALEMIVQQCDDRSMYALPFASMAMIRRTAETALREVA